MTSTPTPEPGERRWVCHKPGWMGPCSPQSTHHNGFDWGCGWIYFPAPSTPGEGTGRPEHVWLNGRCIALHVPKGTRYAVSDNGPEAVAQSADGKVGPVCVTRWADGTTPAPPASPVPPTPTPCPYIVTGGEGTSYCSLAERSAMHAAAPPTPTPQADRDKLEIDVEELLIDHCGMGGTSALTDRILALTDAFTFAAAPPSTPAARAPAAIVDDGEVILAAEGDGYVLTVQINEAGDAVSHRLTADEVRTLLAVTPAEQPQPDGLSAAELLDDLKDRTERGMVELEKLAAPVGACMERTRLLGKLAGLALVADWLRSYDHPTDLTGSEA